MTRSFEKPKISKIEVCDAAFLVFGDFVVIVWWGCGAIGGAESKILDPECNLLWYLEKGVGLG